MRPHGRVAIDGVFTLLPLFSWVHPKELRRIFVKQKWRLKIFNRTQNTKRNMKILPVPKGDYVV